MYLQNLLNGPVTTNKIRGWHLKLPKGTTNYIKKVAFNSSVEPDLNYGIRRLPQDIRHISQEGNIDGE